MQATRTRKEPLKSKDGMRATCPEFTVETDKLDSQSTVLPVGTQQKPDDVSPSTLFADCGSIYKKASTVMDCTDVPEIRHTNRCNLVKANFKPSTSAELCWFL